MSWSHLGAIAERVGLRDRNEELLNVELARRERAFERLKRASIVGGFAATEGIAEPLGRKAVAHLLASREALDQIDGIVERAIDVGAVERPGRVDRLTLIDGSKRAHPIVILEAEPDGIHESVTAFASRDGL